MELVNRTPFTAERVVLRDRAGRDLLVVIVKCAYSLKDGAPPAIADEQVPVQMSDEFYGDPADSSMRYESDLVPAKTGTDVVLIGHAYAPRGRAPQIDVALRAGRLQKVVRVFGDRRWRKTLGSAGIPSPEPFERIPLVYERAFGGRDLSAPRAEDQEQEARNPIGRGFVARKSKRDLDGYPLPNLEDPAHLISRPTDRPEPAGFGFIGRHWQPRLERAGTYDDAWKKNRCPLPPDDFDESYFNGAPPALVSRPFLQGNEPVEVLNASRRSQLRFSLPGLRPRVRVLMGDDPIPLDTTFDTLVLEPDRDRFSMGWRGALDIDRRVERVEGIEVSAPA